MPVYRLGPEPIFPPVEAAEPDGLLAVGGDLSVERLLAAYAAGIFPWYEEGQPVLWHAPDPRWVLPLAELHLPRRLARSLRQAPYRLSLDADFAGVIAGCAETPRPGQRGTWITDAMRAGYGALHAQGFAHSVEAWQGERLVGGLYGVSLGSWFFGESMFARAADASKHCLVALARQLLCWGIAHLDCQIETEHMARFAARGWPRARFQAELARGLRRPTRRGPWRFEPEDQILPERGGAA